MSDHDHHSNTREQNVISRAFQLDEPFPGSYGGRSPQCVKLLRVQAIAVGAQPSPGETLHLEHCRRCNRILNGARAEREAVESDMKRLTTMGPVPTSMPEGGMAADRCIASVCAAVHHALALQMSGSNTPWSLEGGLALLKQLRSGLYGAASMDVEVRRRLAAEYANAVAEAPPPIKAALVYGLIVLRMERRFAIDVVREIARRDDPLAHQIMVYTLSTEGETILAIDGDCWSRLVEASDPVVREYRMRAERATAHFARKIEPPYTLHEARMVLRKTLVEMVDVTFKSRDAVETILHLLAVRQYLGAAFSQATAVGSDVVEYFPRLVPLVFRRAQRPGQCAPKALVLEVCEKLEPLDAVQLYIKRLEFTWPTRPRQAAAKATEAGNM